MIGTRIVKSITILPGTIGLNRGKCRISCKDLIISIIYSIAPDITMLRAKAMISINLRLAWDVAALSYILCVNAVFGVCFLIFYFISLEDSCSSVCVWSEKNKLLSRILNTNSSWISSGLMAIGSLKFNCKSNCSGENLTTSHVKFSDEMLKPDSSCLFKAGST